MPFFPAVTPSSAFMNLLAARYVTFSLFCRLLAETPYSINNLEAILRAACKLPLVCYTPNICTVKTQDETSCSFVRLPFFSMDCGFGIEAQGEVCAEGILHLASPNLGSNSGIQILSNEFGAEFWGLNVAPFFSINKAPSRNSPARNSHQSI